MRRPLLCCKGESPGLLCVKMCTVYGVVCTQNRYYCSKLFTWNHPAVVSHKPILSILISILIQYGYVLSTLSPSMDSPTSTSGICRQVPHMYPPSLKKYSTEYSTVLSINNFAYSSNPCLRRYLLPLRGGGRVED